MLISGGRGYIRSQNNRIRKTSYMYEKGNVEVSAQVLGFRRREREREMACTVGFRLETSSRSNVILGYRKRDENERQTDGRTERHLSVTHLRWMSACLPGGEAKRRKEEYSISLKISLLIFVG